MKPAMSMYISIGDLKKAQEAYLAGRMAAMLGAKRDQKPDRFGFEWYWGWDEQMGV